MQLNHTRSNDYRSIQWEDEDTGFQDGLSNTEFAALLSEEAPKGSVREGSIVVGRVVRVTSDAVVVDIGHKTEGEIPLHEFQVNRASDLTFKAGDSLEVYLDSFEDQEGEMVLSYERAEMLRAWDRIAGAFEREETVEGTITARVKGGLSVDIGVKAFLPGSQVDLRPVRNLDKLVGTKFQFKIIKFNKKRGNIVLSRRVLLEEDRAKLRTATLTNLRPDAILRGIVKNITDYGAFIDLGGIDGLLHITDMSWGRISHPSELFEVGQEVDVKVLSYDEARQRVSLGYKQLQSDPWLSAVAKYPVNTRVVGRVVSLTDYGAFVALEAGIEGLIHISEMSWSKRIKHPSRLVQVGDEVEVMVLALDMENRRISLGMKQIEPNPWEIVQQKYRVNDVIRGKIRNITDFGIFVGIEDGIDGLIHISDISWTKKVKHPGELFKKGDEIETKILAIDVEGEKFSLGIKQLSEDPWLKSSERFRPGTKGTGIVSKVADFGAFVELEEGIEGLIHISELSDETVTKVTDILKEGDTVEYIVLASDSEERRFSLSRRALLKHLEGQELAEYINKVTEIKTSLADAFSRAQATEKTRQVPTASATESDLPSDS